MDGVASWLLHVLTRWITPLPVPKGSYKHSTDRLKHKETDTTMDYRFRALLDDSLAFRTTLRSHDIARQGELTLLSTPGARGLNEARGKPRQ